MSSESRNERSLSTLYPFLSGQRRPAAEMESSALRAVLEKSRDSRAAMEAFFAEQDGALVAMAGALAEVYRRAGRLYSMGNGGSSCDAAHIAVEFLHPVTAGRPALTAVNLGNDLAMLTAVGNDIGWKHVFVRQVAAQARRGDALVGFSTSGNSENLLLAFAKARELGVVTMGFAGMDGGRMAKAGLDHCLVVRTDSIHRVQECHVAAYHILWDLVHTFLADDRGGLAAGDEA